MIIRFSFKNFRSYRDETELSFEALDNAYNRGNVYAVTLRDGSKINLLKSAVIYGANASGKSNVIAALAKLQMLVTQSADHRTNQPLSRDSFMLDSKIAEMPTEMTVDFLTRGVVYRYQVNYNGIVHFEGLWKKVGADFLEVYTVRRESQNTTINVGEGWTDTTLDLSGIRLLPQHLLLSELATKPIEIISDVYNAIADSRVVELKNHISLKANIFYVAETILKEKQSVIAQRLLRLIHLADLGIEGFGLQHNSDDAFKFPDNIDARVKRSFIEENRWVVTTSHRGYDSQHNSTLFEMLMDNESAGTKRLFELGAIILDALERGIVLAYDEMNIAIHPELQKLLVEMFNNPQSNPNGAQLIFTTHDISILGKQRMFRADQIWFAEKEKNGASQLFSAQDFEGVNIDDDFEAMYKAGLFGAIPKYGPLEYIFQQQVKSDEKE